MFKNVVAREYNYQDVYLRPRHTLVNSRKECDTGVVLVGIGLSCQFIPQI